MMFKLIIVEDEKIMREGYANFINWKSMGFEVAAKLADGRDAIEYIRDNQVDVVLTDIKMTFVSGIELAKYIYDNKLPVKVILVSGFRDFEYAREAMRYNVNHFLLKPAPVKDIEVLFTEIRLQLEKDIHLKEKDRQKNEKFDEIIKLLTEQFYTDIALGFLNTPEEINKRKALLNLNIDLDTTKCSIINIAVKDFKSFMETGWKYGKDGLYNAIRNIIGNGEIPFDFYTLSVSNNAIRMLAVPQRNDDDENKINELDRHLTAARNNVKLFLGLDAAIRVEKTYNNIYEISRDTASFSEMDALSTEIVTKEGNGNIIDLVKEYIHQNYNSDISLEDISAHLFISPIYLSRVFKEQTGENYIDYLIKVRMETAISLLKDRRYKVYEIGEMVGYGSIKYFYKVFKRFTGQTPTEYREKLYGREVPHYDGTSREGNESNEE